jgi:hypothetical protein
LGKKNSAVLKQRELELTLNKTKTHQPVMGSFAPDMAHTRTFLQGTLRFSISVLLMHN